jgi:hypothetical protein
MKSLEMRKNVSCCSPLSRISGARTTYPSGDEIWAFLREKAVPSTPDRRVNGGDMVLTRRRGRPSIDCLVMFRALSRGAQDTAGNSRGLWHQDRGRIHRKKLSTTGLTI